MQTRLVTNASFGAMCVILYHASARTLLVLACVCTVTCGVLHSGVRAGEDPAFAIYTLSVADDLLHYLAEDLDGDGLKDIVVIHRKGLPPQETRWVSVFWNDAVNGFSTAADQSWELDTEAVIMDIGDVAGDSQKEICYLTSADVRFHALVSDGYINDADVLLKTSGLAVFPSKRGIPLIDFVRDWTGDGRDDVGVFAFKGLLIHMRDSQGVYSSENELFIELETDMDRSGSRTQRDLTAGLHASYSFPDIMLVDYDGDGRDDLVAITDDRVMVFKRGEGGRYTMDTHEDILFDVLTQEEKIEEFAEVETIVDELNNDGYADAVVIKQTAKGLTNFRGVVNIFWGAPGGYGVDPDQVIISEGTASAEAIFCDVNGDGRKDLILPSIKFNIATVIRILITRSIQVNFNIFLLNADDRLSERPDYTKEIKFKIDLSGESDAQAMDLEGDYNGDKRSDFVFATNEKELSVYLGVSEGDRLFSKKPSVKVAVDAYGKLDDHDLNNDGYSDMIIYYPQNKERKGVIEVLMNLRKLR